MLVSCCRIACGLFRRGQALGRNGFDWVHDELGPGDDYAIGAEPEWNLQGVGVPVVMQLFRGAEITGKSS